MQKFENAQKYEVHGSIKGKKKVGKCHQSVTKRLLNKKKVPIYRHFFGAADGTSFAIFRHVCSFYKLHSRSYGKSHPLYSDALCRCIQRQSRCRGQVLPYSKKETTRWVISFLVRVLITDLQKMILMTATYAFQISYQLKQKGIAHESITHHSCKILKNQ